MNVRHQWKLGNFKDSNTDVTEVVIVSDDPSFDFQTFGCVDEDESDDDFIEDFGRIHRCLQLVYHFAEKC